MWTDKQTETITFLHPSDAGGNKCYNLVISITEVLNGWKWFTQIVCIIRIKQRNDHLLPCGFFYLALNCDEMIEVAVKSWRNLFHSKYRYVKHAKLKSFPILLPPGYVVRQEGTVFTGVCLFIQAGTPSPSCNISTGTTSFTGRYPSDWSQVPSQGVPQDGVSPGQGWDTPWSGMGYPPPG